MPKGGSKKRNEPTSSPEESPPKAKGVSTSDKACSTESPERLDVQSFDETKYSPSKLEDIARKHLKSRSCIIQSLTNEQASEIGLKIFRKWVLFREKLRSKPGATPKKSKVEKEGKLEELGATAQEESSSMDQSEGSDVVSLVIEQMEELESSRFLEESERGAKKRGKDAMDVEVKDTREIAVARGIEAWERHMTRKDAISHHKALQMVAVTVRDSAHLVDRLTVALSELKDKMNSPSSPERRPEVHEAFIQDLHKAKASCNTLSSNTDQSFTSFEWDTPPGSVSDTRTEEKPALLSETRV